MISLYNAGGAIAAFMVFQYLWLSRLSRNTSVHRALIFICAFVAVYMFASAQVLRSGDIELARTFLHWQNLGIFGYVVGIVWLTAYLAEATQYRWARLLLIGVTLFTVVLAAISLSLPWGFLLESVSITGTAVAFNETITTFEYQPHPRAAVAFILTYGMIAWGLWCSYRLYNNRQPYVASLLLFFFLVVAFLHTGNTLYQLGWVETNTPRGLTPFVLFFIVALLFGHEQRELFGAMNRQRDQLREEVERRRSAEEKALIQAYTDELTGLPNRYKLCEILQRELNAGAGDLKLVLIHIDRLRRVKQTFGDDNAEGFVLEFTRRLMADSRVRVLTARVSETVFAVLTRETQNLSIDRDKGSGNWRDTRPLEEPYLIGYQYFSPTFSIGVIDITPDDSAESALHKADLALEASQAKKDKFSVVYYNQELADEIALQHQLERDLRDATRHGQLTLQFQPKVDREGQMVGAEALLRWHHPTQGNVPPSVFIPLAERGGLMGTIGNWVLETCCAHLRNWRLRDAHPGRLSINISAWQLQDEHFADGVLAALERHDVDASEITLELTESAIVEDMEKSRRQLQELRKAGVHIALDDFGTGFSSLAYLGNLPLDELKIDKSFIDGLYDTINRTNGNRTNGNSTNGNDTKGRQLLHGLLDIGNALELAVVAEGVETLEQHQILRAMGFKYFQGFLFSRPLSEDDFLSWNPTALTG